MSVQSYQQVLDHLKASRRQKHILFGNGFSIAYSPSIFSYNALSKFVEQTSNDLLKNMFKVFKTKNFESIMQQLGTTIEIIKALDSKSDMITKVEEASMSLKESLIDAVKALHPEHVFTIGKTESEWCASFLSDYLEKDSKIFSTNYDLLLYWVLMRNELPNAIDGFGRDAIDQGEYVPPEEVVWSELRWGNNRANQNIFYLHGALQLFDDGIEIIKEEYDGSYILENIKKRMDKGHYPIFVTAGTSEEKLSHILHNHYLADCYDNLSTIGGSLITLGFNFGPYDEHIIRAINEAATQDPSRKLWSIYIGVFSEDDEKHIESIKEKFKCKVNMFDSRTAHIWR